MVTANLVNFGILIYEGDSLYAAMEAVKKAGFAAVIQFDGDYAASFCPIGGWRFR